MQFLQEVEAGITENNALTHPYWTLDNPVESWIIIDPVNLSQYEGCFDVKLQIWTKMNLTSDQIYLDDGRTPINLEFYVSDNYTSDVTTTNWILVNSDMESEINSNGMIFSGRPYPGDQSGPDPDNVKDANKNANNLWVGLNWIYQIMFQVLYLLLQLGMLLILIRHR